MLKLEKITKEYSQVLFEDISLILGNKEKVGLVGLNGCGKSTLIKLIAGIEEPSKGEVHVVSEKIGYLPQVLSLKEEYVGEYLETLVEDIHADMWRVERVLGQLDFGEYDEFDKIKTLSPGQIMKLYLTGLIMKESTILLLDEPTNHLDIRGIETLEKFIRRFDGICIIISHDREFLNNATNMTIEIDEHKLNIYSGNYDYFVEEKERRIEERAKQVYLQEKKREKLETLIETSRKISDSKKRGKAIRAAKKRLEREVERNEISNYTKKGIRNLEFVGGVHGRKRIVQINNMSFNYGDNLIFANTNLEIYGAETIWIQGQNGSGKTTLIKLLTGDLLPSEGEIKWGNNIRISYFSQNQTEELGNKGPSPTVQNYFFEQTAVNWNDSYKVLDNFMFDTDLRDKRIDKLSPGQKARLTFAIFTQQEYECLILDEPTNHLDIETKETIENALREFKGTIFLVSHDRYFAQMLEPDRVMTIKGKKLVEV